ncbi:hypothetical protein FB451DRAFT_1415753 [Mycena latifolia]|nr:hypothetical protein FB451DRAFT_1415753 [Mycena latifolia]
MSPISLEMAEMLAFILELVAYGIFLVFFSITLWVLFHKSHDGRINKALLATILLLFAISTAHLVVSCVRMTRGFVGGAGTPFGARAYFSDLCNPMHVAKIALFFTQTLIGDSFVIYRCFVVWRPSPNPCRRWGVIALPLALLCGTIASGIGVIYTTTRGAPPGASVFLPALVPWVISFFGFTLCTNVLCTVLIVLRIWFCAHRSVVQHSLLRPFMAVVIESGAIYSGALLALLVMYASGSVGQYPALDYVMPLVGITFSMIIVRVNLGISSTGSPQDGGAKARLKDYSNNLARIVEQELMRNSKMHGKPAPLAKEV